MTPAFPTILDSTMLSAYKSCPHKFYLEYICNWKAKEPSVHLHAGAAFAKGLEIARDAHYVQGLPSAEAVARGMGGLLTAYGAFECPESSAKSATRMAGALEFYFANYPLGSDGAPPIVMPSGKLGIEISFAEPLPISHPETGDPLIYCGRLDMAVDYAGGIYVEDDKTTSQLGATWSRQWDLRSQFTGYCWGLWRAANVKPTGCLVRGVSILKSKYETQQAITYRPDWMLEEWYQGTLQCVEEMKQRWTSGYWRKVFDHACAEYGGCTFKAPCSSDQPERWLETYFHPKLWNPLTREETVL